MGTLVFSLVGISGILLTAFAVSYFTNRKKLTPNNFAMIISVGLLLTFWGSFFLPLIVLGSFPSKTVIIVVISFSIFLGFVVYAIARFYYAMKHKK
jgi:hypothetical protein